MFPDGLIDILRRPPGLGREFKNISLDAFGFQGIDELPALDRILSVDVTVKRRLVRCGLRDRKNGNEQQGSPKHPLFTSRPSELRE